MAGVGLVGVAVGLPRIVDHQVYRSPSPCVGAARPCRPLPLAVFGSTPASQTATPPTGSSPRWTPPGPALLPTVPRGRGARSPRFCRRHGRDREPPRVVPVHLRPPLHAAISCVHLEVTLA